MQMYFEALARVYKLQFFLSEHFFFCLLACQLVPPENEDPFR